MSDFPKVPVLWTPDCQGKWDYDGAFVAISTRYWPRGGGFSVLSAEGFVTNGERGIRPSAHATLYLGNATNEFLDDAGKLTEIEVEGETEAEVKASVEAWAAAQWSRVRKAMLNEFDPEKPHA